MEPNGAFASHVLLKRPKSEQLNVLSVVLMVMLPLTWKREGNDKLYKLGWYSSLRIIIWTYYSKEPLSLILPDPMRVRFGTVKFLRNLLSYTSKVPMSISKAGNST
jgi:hypothetical protein